MRYPLETSKSQKKAGPKDIAPATQLFTPEWIVRYLTDNSLGRLWMLNNTGSDLASEMDYYLAPQKDEEDPFIEVNGPEDITVCDPACGSGHILVYAFDLLFRMYQEEGYMDAEIPALILQGNIFGMEIDPRAAEIASFALEMKAREKDPDFFRKDVDPHITVLEPISFTVQELTGTALAEDHDLLDAFEHLTECGSLYVPKPEDLRDVEDAIKAVHGRGDLFSSDTPDKLKRMKADLEALDRRYNCVIANPPYLGSSKLDPWANDWVKQNYPDEKKDLCTCFINRCLSLAGKTGFVSVITSDTCMYISSFETMRQKLIEQKTIVSLIDTRGSNAHPDVFDANAGWVLCNAPAEGLKGSYFKLDQPISRKAAALEEAVKNPDCGWFYRADQQDFKSIHGWPIAYWLSESVRKAYRNGTTLDDIAHPKVGMQTSNNEKYLRLWWEVPYGDFNGTSNQHIWIKYLKGGEYRKWYGNLYYLLHYKKNPNYILQQKNARVLDLSFLQMRKCTWSDVTSGLPSFRYAPMDTFYDISGHCFFPSSEWEQMILLGYVNTSFVTMLKNVFNSTFHFQVGDLRKILAPKLDESSANNVYEESKENVSISKADWDSFETSWDFTFHPLAQYGEPLISNQFARWSSECRERFDTLKSNEEELNRIFARIYHMEGEVPIEVPDDKVSVRLADEQRDVKSLISYGIGCIFGRYSTDKPGLILADAGQTAGDYRAKVSESGFSVDEDAVLPVIAFEDVSLGDDIVRRFRGWLSYVYGDEALDDNVSYIESVLGKDLRAYFAKDFYKDHCDTYSVQGSGKRPIYWMFSSPKGSFQALVYMHRMNRDTVSTVLTEYVRPFRQRLLAQIGVLRATGAARDVAKADKYQAMVDELEGWEHDVLYPLSQKHVTIDLDDGVRHNYKLFRTDDGDALAKVSGLS